MHNPSSNAVPPKKGVGVIPDGYLLGPGGVLVPERLGKEWVRKGLTLPPRCAQTLSLLALGFTVPEIAKEMHTSQDTVYSQLKIAIGKLGAKNKAHAIALAYQHGILSAEVREEDELRLTTEYGQLFRGGSVLVRPNDPEIEKIYPLKNFIRAHSQNGGKVLKRSIIPMTDWEVVKP